MIRVGIVVILFLALPIVAQPQSSSSFVLDLPNAPGVPTAHASEKFEFPTYPPFKGLNFEKPRSHLDFKLGEPITSGKPWHVHVDDYVSRSMLQLHLKPFERILRSSLEQKARRQKY